MTEARLLRVALAATLLTVPFMLHAFAFAEATIGLTSGCFLIRCALAGDWRFLRGTWMRVGLAWWGWLVICSLPGIGAGGWPSLVQALVTVRYLVFAAALEHWVLADGAARRWLLGVLAACAAWIAGQALVQAVFGHNLFGNPRWGDGELTGPFNKPRAGAPLSRLLPPVLLPAVDALVRRRTAWALAGAIALPALAVVVMVLIGQRMPLLLTVLGLLVSALLLRGLRGPVLAALAAGALLLAASAVVSPPSFYRLVTKFSAQMESFPQSPYGLLAARALAMAAEHPWHGRGFNGFRTGCDDPRYFHGWHWPADPKDDGGGAAGCNIHPHNHYMQALTDAGIPGLALFAALVLAWLAVLARGLWARPTPLRVGLFATALMSQWPLASTSSAFAVEIGGLFFVLLGFGLAEARYQTSFASVAGSPAARLEKAGVSPRASAPS